jgi:ribonuclease Z
MTKLIFLGTGAAVPDEKHQNTHLALIGQERLVLIDCTGDPILRLARFGIDLPHNLTDILLTHFHPDHVSGAPSLLMASWLKGRKTSLSIHGLSHTMERAEKMMDLFEWKEWPNFYSVHFHAIPDQELAPVLDCPEFRILASPVCHLLPTMGLRVECASGQSLAYSCDTEPCEAVVRLAKDVDILIHEATGKSQGHSSAEQAGEIARRAGAKALYLIHYPTGQFDPEPLLAQASTCFPGPVFLAKDLMEIEL